MSSFLWLDCLCVLLIDVVDGNLELCDYIFYIFMDEKFECGWFFVLVIEV